MHKKLKDVQPLIKEAPRGGKGKPKFYHMFSPDEMNDKLNMLAKIILHPGDAIGYHDHPDDLEVYYILEGKLEVNDNGSWFTASPGDAIFTTNGQFHEVINNSKENASMLAFIVPK